MFSCLYVHAANWIPYGPYGGDARAFAADPHDNSHLYLGTLTGWIYETHDGGTNWKRLALIGDRDDLALDSIVVDRSNPKHLVVGAWVLGSVDGGIYTSDDGGLTWKAAADMHGQSIRALTPAPSDPKVLVAGTLKGVYRSADGGEHWTLISPEGSQELHEVESIAIDPANPQVIYAGTWHLPWKTTDGGQHWTNIKQGVIDDSDVFSIIVDPKNPQVVYASACSGIYKSETAGEKFQKVQGIPSTARRTRVLMQDPENLNIVFAGTTEGLFRSADSGATWQRTTGTEVIVNDVYVDPHNTNRVLLATDRAGVLASNDGGYSFVASNNGFSTRQVTAYVADAKQLSTIYVGVINDKAAGGVFVSDNGGLTWAQKSAGLDSHNVFSLGQASDGTVLAGTGHGLYRLQGDAWSRVENVTAEPEEEAPKPPPTSGKRKSASAARIAARAAAAERREVAARKAAEAKKYAHLSDTGINAIARTGDTLYVATEQGLLQSTTAGTSWKLLNAPLRQDWIFVAAAKSTVAVAGLQSISLSIDGGEKWQTVKLPDTLKQVGALAVDDAGGLWVGGREGIFLSADNGGSWQTLKNFFVSDVDSLFFDEASQRLLATSTNKSTLVFALHLPDRSVRYWAAGWNLRFVRPIGDSLIGATRYDGMVIQPRMVDSAEVKSH